MLLGTLDTDNNLYCSHRIIVITPSIKDIGKLLDSPDIFQRKKNFPSDGPYTIILYYNQLPLADAINEKHDFNRKYMIEYHSLTNDI